MLHFSVGLEAMNGQDASITDGSFIPLVLDCPLPPGVNPAVARVEFLYEANDPGNMMTTKALIITLLLITVGCPVASWAIETNPIP